MHQTLSNAEDSLEGEVGDRGGHEWNMPQYALIV
jgi:hypothetical protein